MENAPYILLMSIILEKKVMKPPYLTRKLSTCGQNEGLLLRSHTTNYDPIDLHVLSATR